MFLKSKEFWSQLVYGIIMALMLAVVSLINFVEFSFNLERLLNADFWVQYFVTLALGLFSFFASVQSEKLKRKNSPEIRGAVEQLYAYFSFITANDGLYGKFKAYLERENEAKKLKLYIISLKKKREKAKKQEDIDKIDALIASAKEDVDFKEVKFSKKTVNLIFAGFRTKDDDELLAFSGHEKMVEYLAPAVTISVIITMLMLSFSIGSGSATLDKIIQLVTRLFTVGAYIFRANAYADYSIFTIYKSALENRKGVVQCFFDEIGYKVNMKENPFYMFKGEKEEKGEEEKTNGKEKTDII